MSERFHVVKRSGAHEEIDFNKITQRIAREAVGLSQHIDPAGIAAKVIAGMRPGITTVQLDQLAAETCAALITRHPDFGVLAARLAVTSLYKRTRERFSDVVEALAGCVSHGRPAPLITEHVLAFVRRNAAALDAAVAAGHARDSDYDYFGYRTLERSYLLKLGDAIAERPQHMLMRVAVGIHAHEDDLAAALETYDLISRGLFTHASPTLFNAGTPSAQLASCFLLQIGADSIEGIYDALKECALISKGAGGIGLSVHAVRARGTYIAGTNGESNGLVPMLRVFNNTARYVDQGGGKRKGAFAIYLEPWHADIYEFVDLPRPVGSEDLRARDLFYALWIPDLFMQRVESDGVWSLMCPHECPGLNTCHGDAFRELYEGYEAAGRFQRQVKARHLWAHIISAQIESGRPYMLYKDAANAKSNHQHLGTIQSSNLCTEIVEFTSPDEIAVCNLASIALPRFLRDGVFDFALFAEVVAVAVRNLNRVIDINHYPLDKARNSNLRHRPIGLGVQGLADLYMMLGLPYESPGATELNKQIFETLYFAACDASCALAEQEGVYASYAGSPTSQGRLQFDLWGVTPPAGRHDWAGLKARIAAHGLRNSLLVAPMPTATTSHILGWNEGTAPILSNVFSRKVLAGDFIVINKHLVLALEKLGLWSEEMKQRIVAADGSVQGIDVIPLALREVYKTVWEISQRVIIDAAADRGPYIDQSQSMNLYPAQLTLASISSMHFHTWRRGLKTGMYYMHVQPTARAAAVTVEATAIGAPAAEAPVVCDRTNRDCAACSS